MLSYLLYGLFILACVVLVVAVLLQPGKSDAGAMFSSSVSSTAFGPRGTASILAKVTIGAAVSFMLIALMLSQPAITGSHSVLRSGAGSSSSPQPSPSASAAPATVATPLPAASPLDNSNAKPADKTASPEPKKSPAASPGK